MTTKRQLALQSELAAAKSELRSWLLMNASRKEGSGAQDRRNEQRGEALEDKIKSIEHEIRQISDS